MRYRFLFLPILCFFVSLSLALANESLDAPLSAPTNNLFGVVEAYYRPVEAAELGVSWERVIFAWNTFQPDGPDDFDTSAVPETYLQSANLSNRQIVGLIKGTALWASPSGSVGAVPDGIHLPYDHPDNVYGAFVRRLVRYYSARGIHDWIIMNEPDVRTPEEGNVVEFQGDVEDYFAMLKVAYLATKSVDPDSHIQIAGMAWWSDHATGRRPYLERLLSLISQDLGAEQNNWYFDGITLHLYFTTANVWKVINDNRAILQRFGQGGKEIWIGEFNASPRRDPIAGIDAPFEISLQQQADYIVQASALALAAGVDRLSVDRLYDDNFVPGETEPWGLVRYDGTLRPAFYAYQEVIRRFGGAQQVRRYHIPEATLITFTFSDSILYVMWSDTEQPGEFLLNLGSSLDPVTIFDSEGADWTVEVEQQMGTSIAVIDSPGAERIDAPWIVVSGAVRMVELEGRRRTVWFRTHDGRVGQFN
jgi:hypothetical protein